MARAAGDWQGPSTALGWDKALLRTIPQMRTDACGWLCAVCVPCTAYGMVPPDWLQPYADVGEFWRQGAGVPTRAWLCAWAWGVMDAHLQRASRLQTRAVRARGATFCKTQRVVAETMPQAATLQGAARS